MSMTAEEFRAALHRLRLRQIDFAAFAGVVRRTANKYATEGPSAEAARIVQLLELLPARTQDILLGPRGELNGRSIRQRDRDRRIRDTSSPDLHGGTPD
jgi:hypothetical protein